MANDQTFTFNIKAVADMKDVVSNVQNIRNALKQLKLPNDLQDSFKKTFGDLEKELDKYQKLMAGGFKTKGDATALEKSGKNIIHLYDEVLKKIKSLDDNQLKKAFEDLGAKEVEKLKKELTDLQDQLKQNVKSKASIVDFKQAKTELSGFKKEFEGVGGTIEKTWKTLSNSTINTFAKNLNEGNLELAANNLKKIAEQVDILESDKKGNLHQWLDNLSNKFKEIKDDSGIKGTVDQVQKLKQELSTAKANVLQGLIDGFKNGTIEAEKFEQEARKIIEAENDRGRATAQANKEIDQIKSRIQIFFGLSNVINLVKRAIRSAVSTIKELDKAMTETAVVTDFTVSDMWEQLPEYTKRANELGVTTLAAYKAATLYYQQGLKTNEVNALSVETLKMARIAGLDAAEATDRMTNALRGFNMALTEANAQRVDDVYSELAANTASNVDEISTAMTKVASLAHNANMEFETTAAFLSQIIETTRESAETAGTALKTVVARFSEVKKLVDENQIRGQDEEGQIIDVNRVGAALRTAGIDLNKYFIGEVGLDDIFMELASKWDSLTSIQQRYIATQAAGSRQQSRFIALMQDYARTQELVGKAYNANGASARQFEKTQESLESKLNRLKNAWNEFLMGITNSKIVKGFVDLLTNLLNIVNKLTSGFGDVTSSILKMGVAIAAIKGGKALFNSAGFDSLLSIFTGKSANGEKAKGFGQLLTGAGKGIWNGAKNIGNYVWGAGGTTGISAFGEGASLSGAAGVSAGLAGIVTALGAVAVAVGVVAAGYQAWLRLTPEGQLKQAKELAKTMNEVASNTQKAANELKEAKTQLQDYNNSVKQASTTSERKEAISNRNEYISGLIEQNTALAQYVKTVQENGEIVLTIDENAFNAAIDKAAQGAIEASIGANIINGVVAERQAEVYQNKWLVNGVNVKTGKISSWNNETQELEARDWSDTEKAKYLAEYVKQQNAQAESESFYKQAFAQQIANSNIELNDEIANTLSTALAEGFDTDKFQNSVGNKRFWNWMSSQAGEPILRNKYYELYGTYAPEEMGRKQLAEAVAQKQVLNKQLPDVDLIAGYLTGPNKELYNNILNAFNGVGQIQKENITLSDVEISSLSKEELAKLFDFEGADLENFAAALGHDTDELLLHIREQIKNNKELQKANRINLFQKLFESGVNLTSEFQKQINQQTPEWREAALDAITGAEDLLNEDLFKSFNEQITSLSVDQLKEFSEFFNSIDLDNPIEALKTLNSYAEDSPFYNYAESIKKSNEELFSTSGLVQSFITSADYESLTEQLADFIKENGEISGKNIEELAKDCDQLNDLLELAEVNTYGLARAFTLVEKGTIGFESLTDGILKAFSATMTLTDAIDELSSFIDDFDPGRDFGKGADFFHEQAENLQELVDSYEFGNEKTAGIYDALFGKGAYKAFLESHWEEGPEKVAELITEKIKKQDYYLRDNSYGFMETFAGKNTEFGTITKSETSDYDFEWDIGDRTTEQLIESIQEEFKTRGESISREAAESIISGWAAQSWDFADKLNTNDYNAAVKEFANNLGDSLTISQEQLEAFAKAYGKEVTDVEESLRTLRAEANQPYLITVKWVDENGNKLSGDSLHKQVMDTIANSENKLSVFDILGDSLNKEAHQINAEQALTNIKVALNLDDEQAKEELNRFAEITGSQLTEQIEVPVKLTVNDDGTITVEKEIQTVIGNTYTDLKENINLALADANYNSIGQSLADQNLNAFKDKITGAIESAGSEGAAKLTTSLEGINPDITVEIKWKWKDNQPPTATNGGTVEIEGAGAKGGIVRSLAAGLSDHFLQPGFALTGEEGAEIVWNKEKGYAYVTGKNGPQFQNLQPGDRVFNAQETSRIFRNSSFAKGGLYESYANGKTTGGYNPNKLTDSNSGGGGSGSGKDKEKEEKWKNEVDWLYNLVEDIAELERVQTKLQEDYEDYLIDEAKTGKDLYNLLIQQLGNLYTQLDHQTFALEKREQEMREFMDTTNKYDSYLWYNWEDRTLEIDWDQIEAIKASDKETYDEIVDLISEAESIQDKMDDAEDSVMDIKNQIQELENIWRDTFTDFEDRVYSAIVKEYQTVIDNYSELNETLNNSNNAILSALQKQISLERQIRDNTKTEEEIGDTEAQLAFLRRDTSGGNELAALQLEQQLNDSRQSYEDSLVDQAISRLQEDNDAAAQQREHQIEIMQAQLDYQSQSGEFNAMVLDLLNSAMGADGELLTNSDLVALLKTQENWGAMSAVSKQVWEEELNTTFKEVAAFLLKQNAEENGTFVTALTGALGAVNATIGSYSQGMMKYLNSSSSSGGGGSGGSKNTGGGGSSEWYWYGNDTDKAGVVSSPTGTLVDTRTVNGTTYYYYEQGNGAQYVYKRQKKSKGYATGGLNTSTGLAWLDGTKSEPEYVLNARQTDAFLRLADVLPNVMSNQSQVTNTFGGVNLNLVMNVDQIASDYDVDRIADRVKDIIYDVGSYRNVNTLNFSR